MVGNTSATTEKALWKLLAPYLADPTTAFVISSDFAHWGSRFRYTYYRPTPGGAGQMLSASAKVKDRAIHESIKEVDFECMGACESGSHEKWLDVLEGNRPSRQQSFRQIPCFGLTWVCRYGKHGVRSSSHRRHYVCYRGASRRWSGCKSGGRSVPLREVREELRSKEGWGE